MPWAIACTWSLATDHWWWALGTGLMAAVSQAIALRDAGLAFAVDHQMPADSHEFLDSMEGSTGVPLVGGNAVAILNNGDEFYPEMLAAVRGAQRSITIEAYIYWRGEIGMEFAAGHRRPGQGRRAGQAAARHGRLGDDRRRDPEDARGRRLPARRGSTRSTGTRSIASTTAPTASR